MDDGRTLEDVERGLDMPLQEALTTQRAVRRVLPDAVDDAIVLRCIELALKAPTGSNAQGWEFVVVKDRAVKERLAHQYATAWDRYGGVAQAGGDEALAKVLRATEWQVRNFADVPVVVVCCLRDAPPADQPVPPVMASSHYGSIYPAVQNLLLAARAVGLGASLITLPLWNARANIDILGLPDRVQACCAVPMGWPRGRYGPTTRRPVGDVVHLDRFGDQPWRAAPR